ncbi:MAG: heme exporter protein CcmD [Pseudomonadota bacterium]
MELFPIFDKNAAYIWAVYLLAAFILGVTTLITVRRARSAERAQAETHQSQEDVA